jgi:hypothetical protein
MAKVLVEHIEKNQPWLGGLIEARDRMNHFLHGGLSPQHFVVVPTITVVVPVSSLRHARDSGVAGSDTHAWSCRHTDSSGDLQSRSDHALPPSDR